jgi:ssDNA-binding Zn-finger/Zn-ribbon topoisomerase 1
MLCQDNPNCQGVCPFVRDPRDVNRYVCLKCGLERRIDRASGFDFILLFITTVVIIIVLF